MINPWTQVKSYDGHFERSQTAVEAEIPEKIVKSYIWDAMNEEEKEQGDNKLRDLDGNGIKNDNVPQKGVQ